MIRKTYDLEERTAVFAEKIIALVKEITFSPYNRRLIEQLIGSSGSVGANYCEASEAESKKDFIHKLGIAKKELKETKHWIRLLAKAHPEHAEALRNFWRKADELVKIFSQSIKTAKVIDH